MQLREKWVVKGGRAAPIVEKYQIHPLIARILAGRMKEEEVADFINVRKKIFDASLMKDMDKAAAIISKSLDEGKKLYIVGDYDVDGMTSSSILYLGFKRFYPSSLVQVRIPERMEEGYGFSVSICEEILKEGAQIVVTCDNGIREYASADRLKEAGIPMVVTDHHAIALDEEGKDVLPAAYAVVNPHRQDDASPQKEICGAFVAYQLIRYMAMERGIDPDTDKPLKKLKGYAALGTICDVMPLVNENRRLVKEGLKILKEEPTEGIRAMLKVAAVNDMNVYAAGFQIGPMINAGGRLGSQNRYFDIMISDSESLCVSLAKELYTLNKTRQQMTEEAVETGLKKAAETSGMVKVVYLPDVHESIAGLAAGKIREKTGCPVYVVTKGMDGLKGSGRSIENYSMFEAMNRVPEIFKKFGGHAMAAGFALACEEGREEEAVRNMEKVMNETCGLTEEDLAPTVYIDAVCDPARLTMDLVGQMDLLGPFGTGNDRPLLAVKNVVIDFIRIYGKKRNVYEMHCRTLTEDGMGRRWKATGFDTDMLKVMLTEWIGSQETESIFTGGMMKTPIKVDMVYQPEINTYMGMEELKMKVKHLRLSASV